MTAPLLDPDRSPALSLATSPSRRAVMIACCAGLATLNYVSAAPALSIGDIGIEFALTDKAKD